MARRNEAKRAEVIRLAYLLYHAGKLTLSDLARTLADFRRH